MASTPFDFSDRSVIVTGGTRGLGRGLAQAYLGAGAAVVICGRNVPDDPLTADGREAHFVAADVRVPDEIERVVNAALERHDRIDVLVNNAGGAPYAMAADASPRLTEKVIALNLTAPLEFARQVNAVMQGQDDGGNIVNIGSVSGLRPGPGAVAYGAAKAGLHNATQTLALEWAPKVRVNCVIGGMIETEQTEEVYGDAASVQRVARTVPMQRLASPRDVADACLFLTSSMATYITGANLVVHGGGEIRPLYQVAAEGWSP
jgi:NAD(P)-dependent dehydrogenase (short-subunit alcohol dehydrogenase family)